MILVAFVFVLSPSFCLTEETDFRQVYKDWKVKYHKSQVRDIDKASVFEYNFKYVAVHNRQNLSFKLSLNKFSDEEIKLESPSIPCKPTVDIKTSGQAFGQFNWLTKSPIMQKLGVEDQQGCSSCYAMVAVGAVEAWYAIQHNRLVDINVWNVVACTSGCNGGHIDKALIHLQTTEHVTQQASSNINYKNMKCTSKTVLSQHFHFSKLSVNVNYEEIKRSLEEHGPIAIGMFTKLTTFRLYSQGIFDDPECQKSGNEADHAVLIVGYGYDRTYNKNYWIVKNSWSEDWGEKGYMKISRESKCLITCYAFRLNYNSTNAVTPNYVLATTRRIYPTTARKPIAYPTTANKLIRPYSTARKPIAYPTTARKLMPYPPRKLAIAYPTITVRKLIPYPAIAIRGGFNPTTGSIISHRGTTTRTPNKNNTFVKPSESKRKKSCATLKHIMDYKATILIVLISVFQSNLH